ncbi:MAG: hypothetical protein QNJ47_22870 [Nostocaceae cyanobacterium]|nr:hypothetical protein [Nostocaceae cyanobacterium]
MQADLQKLHITPEDLKQITGVSNRDLSAYRKLKSPRLALLLMIVQHIEQILLLGWGLIPLGYLIKWKWLRKRQGNLFDEINQYHQVLKAVDINDQLLAAGNSPISVSEREKVIQALETTRNNLICALKTERILRKNRAFIARHRELLGSNLTALQALEIKQEAGEYTRLINQALEVAQEVQIEMKKLEGD